MASFLTPRQQIRADVMRACLMALIRDPNKAGYGGVETFKGPIKELAPQWREYADILANEILGEPG